MSKDEKIYTNSTDDASDDGLHTEEGSKIDVDVAIAIGNDDDGDNNNNNNIGTTDDDVDVADVGNRNGRSAFTRVYRIPNPNFQSPLYNDRNRNSNENNIDMNPRENHNHNGGVGVSFDSDTNTNNPHENENNDDTNSNNSRDSVPPPTPNNTRVFFWNRRPIPVVQRINGPNSNNTELPRAYPVATTVHSYIIRRRQNINTDYERNHTDDDIWENERDQRKLRCKVTLMSGFMTFLGILIFFNVILYILMFIDKSSVSKSSPEQQAPTDNSTNLTEVETSMQSNSSNSTKEMTSSNPDMTTIMDNNTLASEETNQTSNETLDIDDTIIGTNSSTMNNDEEESIDMSSINNKDRYNYTCYTDPTEIQFLEWDYYEQGKDLSQKRTYIICPNTIMKVFGYTWNLLTFDHLTGDVFPLTIFLPNVHIKCGLDGSLSNNCTFSGKTLHILIEDIPFLFVNYRLPDSIKKENITIEGFRFTQAAGGLNIINVAHYASFTVRDCLFDNNSQMYASIRATAWNVVENHATIENCTFVNNTYYHNPDFTSVNFDGWIPNIAVIMTYPLDPYWNPSIRSPNDPDTMVADLSVSNCVFHNNVFLSKSDTVIAAVINLLPPFTSLSVTDSCFVDNKGYTSGVISISEGDTHIYTSREPSTQFYSGNHFIGNMPYDDNNKTSSCILSRQYIRFGSDGIPERSELQEECEEYNDTNISSNMVCF